MLEWINALMSVDKSTWIIVASICAGSTWVIRHLFSDPMYGIVVHPLLTLTTVFVYVGLQASGFIEPMILTDWIKGLFASIMMGHGLGLAIGLLIIALAGEKAEAVEGDLIKRQKLQSRKPRKFNEGVR